MMERMRFALLSVVIACGSRSARTLDAAAGDAPHADGQLVDGQVIDGEIIDGQVVDGQVVDGQLVDAVVTTPDAVVMMPDASIAPDAALGMPVHITGVVDGLAGATVASNAGTATTNANGEFSLDVASGTELVMRASTADTMHLHMIRGVVAQAGMRTRHFNLVTKAQLSAMSALGVTFDPTKAIVEVNFLHASAGGYGVKLTQASGTVTPPFGIADSGGDYVLATTTQTAFATSVLLANLPPGDTKFTAITPGATLPCQRRDVDPLPLEANTVTWVDFECGTDTTP